ncbi:MAG: type II toxin-antitoxin system PemK/MazF family toxin, partial [Pseudomonadales bacterium]
AKIVAAQRRLVMRRGEVWWANLSDPVGSEPGYRRPVLIVQDNAFNQSQISTVVVAAITSNVFLSGAPGNVRLTKKACGLNRESVVNVSQIITLDKTSLTEKSGRISGKLQQDVDQGLGLALAL